MERSTCYSADIEKKDVLFNAVTRAHEEFIANADPGELFDGLLATPLSITDSEYGFIREARHDAEGARI